uniref:MULE transposase domain-containing protein n=1 Tax=Rhizophagus irregularis (strain DAOM 181602 / DAOM 197198 / MUCL 43194) TaxID=747089 RepID=U9TZE7_RHIID
MQDISLIYHRLLINSNIVKATGIQPVVIITDSDPAVDAAIRQILPSTYLIHCAFHISQNLNKNLRKLLDNDYQNFIHNFYSYPSRVNQDVDMHEYFIQKRISEVVIEQLSNDILKATLNQMIEFVESHNIREIWAINKNVIYNYDEFNDSNTNFCLFNQNNNGFCEEKLTILEQKLIYGKLHRMYKKALNKALQSNSKSEQLINLLQEFTEDGELDLDKLDDINH